MLGWMGLVGAFVAVAPDCASAPEAAAAEALRKGRPGRAVEVLRDSVGPCPVRYAETDPRVPLMAAAVEQSPGESPFTWSSTAAEQFFELHRAFHRGDVDTGLARVRLGMANARHPCAAGAWARVAEGLRQLAGVDSTERPIASRRCKLVDGEPPLYRAIDLASVGSVPSDRAEGVRRLKRALQLLRKHGLRRHAFARHLQQRIARLSR